MKTDIDGYLASPDAQKQTESAQGRLMRAGEMYGGFKVVAFLGRGASGEVWRVRDESLHADFAMKIFAPRENASEKDAARLRRQFIAEARCLARFAHPGIVRVHTLHADGDHPFYTMDLLHPIVRPLPKHKVRKIIGDMLSTLETLHAKGVIHRDIKPANVFLDDQGNAVLADFGIAQIDDADSAGESAPAHATTAFPGDARIAGTPDFSAPEQFIGADATPAADLHAVGRLALWLCDGKPPLSWRWFIMRATNSSPALRYRSAKAMKRAFTTTRLSWWSASVLALLIPLAIAALLLVRGKEPPIRLDADSDVCEIETEWLLPGMEAPVITRAKTITLEGGRDYKIGLLRGWQFYRSRENGTTAGPFRQPLIIEGKGTLYADSIAWHHVVLKSGVKLVTSGEYNGFTHYDASLRQDVEYPVRPSKDANVTNRNDVVYAAYIVEPGAKLVFTDNQNYPESLIERR